MEIEPTSSYLLDRHFYQQSYKTGYDSVEQKAKKTSNSHPKSLKTRFIDLSFKIMQFDMSHVRFQHRYKCDHFPGGPGIWNIQNCVQYIYVISASIYQQYCLAKYIEIFLFCQDPFLSLTDFVYILFRFVNTQRFIKKFPSNTQH